MHGILQLDDVDNARDEKTQENFWDWPGAQGSFLSPMAAGTQAIQQGRRASYRTLGTRNVILVVLFLFLYEETKYSKVVEGVSASVGLAGHAQQVSVDNLKADCKPDLEYPASRVQTNTAGHHELDHKHWI
ncbi:uncharacterized protein NFIA_059340 [Aspergillus fischeri NRRL 181]|uniref:Uncharacterized protein n=1 Tax=Neosartorya fischeri (strain ATCC 1020 / DSM 3700 / CBS 544.65 / FGSC A1164 / JCM 1740 / NRRL 181 / WB 181) TaxID=331117 RepID=A1DP60_NEOFI|nr:uncharacterized protein NFIA_059340 [Aspergillus fischeri NRRL 181]EAW16581.1 hypothetical protein NFIA_059340 [Aspergillus fischeri NRRL 181]